MCMCVLMSFSAYVYVCVVVCLECMCVHVRKCVREHVCVREESLLHAKFQSDTGDVAIFTVM